LSRNRDFLALAKKDVAGNEKEEMNESFMTAGVSSPKMLIIFLQKDSNFRHVAHVQKNLQ